LLAAGQIMGGALQGIAQALYEEAIYDEAGNLVTANLAFYYVPTAAEVAAREAQPPADFRASAEYRRALLSAAVKRALARL